MCGSQADGPETAMIMDGKHPPPAYALFVRFSAVNSVATSHGPLCVTGSIPSRAMAKTAK